MTRLDFIVRGRPIPQGGLRIIPLPGGKRILAPNNSAKLNPWRKRIGKAAKAAMRSAQWQCFAGDAAVYVQLQFCFRKPKTADRAHPTVKPDIDKLVRSCLDALTGIVWVDDSQVVHLTTRKHYAEFERVEVRVERIA
jgi:Holliday junction resolvase RusA-like endonuclease